MNTEHDRRLDDPLIGLVRQDVLPFRTGQTVAQALASLRRQRLGERLVYFYVVDHEGRLSGVIPTRRLLSAEPDVPVESIMMTNVRTLTASATVRDACDAFVRHRHLAFPVVDEDGRLQGTVDVGLFTDEIADVSERQAVEDAFQLIGVHLAEAATPWRGFKDRAPWLSFNVAGGLIVAVMAGFYESLLETVVALALFIPVVLALAESVSIQSVTLTLQRLHLPRFSRQRFMAALWREVMTAALLGLACGVTVALVAWSWKGSVTVAVSVGAAIWASMVTACAIGVVLPTALRALRRDPKVAAGPIVLAAADLATLMFYFNLSAMLLK
jgi:magnesium transporter